MAHPSRYKWVVGHLKPELSKYCRVSTSWDTKGIGCWQNQKRSWQMYTEDATHHMVIQDDVKVCNNFIPAVLKALEANPDNAISWSNHATNASLAIRDDQHWITMSYGCCGQCNTLPISMIKPFIAWEMATFNQSNEGKFLRSNADTRLSAFLAEQNMVTYSPVPYLVDHVEMGSLLHHSVAVASEYFCAIDNPQDINWAVPERPHHSTSWIRTSNYPKGTLIDYPQETLHVYELTRRRQEHGTKS
jgi:hypothetical protein